MNCLRKWRKQMIKLITHTPNPEELLKRSYSQCYQKEINYEKMIQFLKHESVLEHINYTFEVKCSRIAHLQWVRHRIASFTSQSHRFTEPSSSDLYHFIPKEVLENDDVDEWIKDMEEQYKIYEKWRRKGYKKETARYQIPDSCAISFQVTMNLRSILNFLSLRTDKHAQEEIKKEATNLMEVVFDTMPNLKPHLEALVERKKH